MYPAMQDVSDYRDNRSQNSGQKQLKRAKIASQNEAIPTLMRSSRYDDNKWECVVEYFKSFVSKICSKGKNST